MRYQRQFKDVPQTVQSKPGQVKNEAGGFVYEADKWIRLNRFLILGTDGDTYYATERELTLQNSIIIQECLLEDGKRTVDTIVGISTNNRALKNSEALFALALAASPKYASAQTNAYALGVLSHVARTGTHLFEFIAYAELFRGWGRAFARAIGMWYLDKEPAALTYQLVKYRQRNGWSHRDVLRLAHPFTSNAELNYILSWVVGEGEVVFSDPSFSDALKYLDDFNELQKATEVDSVIDMINRHNFTHEMLPTQFKTHKNVWAALLQKMPMTAMIRNLGNMSNYGLFDNFSPQVDLVVDTLQDQEIIRKSRVHPFTILKALQTYSTGHGFRGSSTWRVEGRITDALNDAFYLAFQNVQPTNAKMLVGIDISGSMSNTRLNNMNDMLAYQGAAAEALLLLNIEPNVQIVAFDTTLKATNLSARQRLDDATRSLTHMQHGGTDCAQPILWAEQQGFVYDAIIIMTDDQTWAGKEQVDVVFDRYQRKVNPNAKLILMSFVANAHTMVEMNNPSIFRIAGMDADTPAIINRFIIGEI